jgi:hypothetical protein
MASGAARSVEGHAGQGERLTLGADWPALRPRDTGAACMWVGTARARFDSWVMSTYTAGFESGPQQLQKPAGRSGNETGPRVGLVTGQRRPGVGAAAMGGGSMRVPVTHCPGVCRLRRWSLEAASKDKE